MANQEKKSEKKKSLLERLSKLNIIIGTIALAGAFALEAVGLISGNVANIVIAFGALQFAEAAIEKTVANWRRRQKEKKPKKQISGALATAH